MAEETLRITITAENKQALAALYQTVTSLEGVSIAGKNTGGATAKLGKDFTGLSRVIQDLPYGFNAISNNLTQLLPAAGAAGLAFSGIVAALTVAQIGFGAWTRGIGGASKATQDAAKANEEYLGGLAKEITQLQLLYTTSTNANVPMEARIDAVKRMRDEYGEYLKNFTDEEIMAGKAGEAYRGLATAISMAAKARAASSMIEKAYLEKITLEQEIANKEKQKNIDLSNVKGAGVLIGQGGSGLGTGQGKVLSIEERKLIINNKFNESVAETKVKIWELDQQIGSLSATYEKSLLKPMKAIKDIKEKSTAPKENFDGKDLYYMEKMKEYLPILDRFNAKKAAQGTMAPISIAPKLDTGTKDITNLQLNAEANRTLNSLAAERNQLQISFDNQLKESQAGAMTDYLMNSFTGLVSAMQNGQNIGAAIGDMFKKMAIDIAMAAAKALIFQTILSALTAGGANAGFIKGIGSLLGLKGFASGGTVSGPQSGYPVMLHGTEHIVRPDQMKSIIASAAQMGGSAGGRVEVYGRIQGQDIWLSQQRTNTFRNLSA